MVSLLRNSLKFAKFAIKHSCVACMHKREAQSPSMESFGLASLMQKRSRRFCHMVPCSNRTLNAGQIKTPARMIQQGSKIICLAVLAIDGLIPRSAWMRESGFGHGFCTWMYLCRESTWKCEATALCREGHGWPRAASYFLE